MNLSPWQDSAHVVELQRAVEDGRDQLLTHKLCKIGKYYRFINVEILSQIL